VGRVSIQHVRRALSVRTLSSPQKFVLVVLAEHAHDQTGEAWPSVSTISDETALSESAVRKALAALRDQEFIRIRHPANTVRASTTYGLFPEVQGRLFLVQDPLYPEQGTPSTSDRGTPVPGTGKPEDEPEVEPERTRAAFVNSAVGQVMGMSKERGLTVIAGKVRAVAGALFSADNDTNPDHFARAYVALRMQGRSPTAEMVADGIANRPSGYGASMRDTNRDHWANGGGFAAEEGPPT
jgi:hypothetical protein